MKRAILTCALAFCLSGIHAQPEPHRQFNFGIPEKQPATTMPKSEFSIHSSSRKAKIELPGRFSETTPNEYVLSQGWEMAEADKMTTAPVSIFDTGLDTSDWYNATVPGTVLTTLVEQGVYPDPYWGLNNLTIPDTLCRMDWWYRNVFEMPRPINNERVELVLNGINYFAEVWLNKVRLGTIRGAFRRGIYDITDIVRNDGPNVLAVKILPPFNPGIPNEANGEDHGPNGGILCLDGPTFISSEGWDWVPGIRDRNIGIWQDVRLRFDGMASITDPQIITDLPLPDTSYVNLTIRTGLSNHSDNARRLHLNIQVGDKVSASYPVTLDAKEQRELIITPDEAPELRMDDPKLWWPNGYGPQNLYRMNLSLVDESGNVVDRREVRFGVRELDYELMAWNDDRDSVRIGFNPVAAWREGNITFDNLNRKFVGGFRVIPYLNTPLGSGGVTPIDDEAMGPYLVVKVNGQPIFCKGGNWGMDDAMKRVDRDRLEPFFQLHKDMHFTMIRNWTGESTQESFYELADEYGILIYNDFWLSTEGYNLNPTDNKLFLENVEETVRRYRNHPSLAVWCPRNEGFAPDSLEKYINRIIAQEDGTRHYTSNSINMNQSTSGPWDYKYDPGFYYRLAGGFRTEVGAPGFPTATTVGRFMAPEDTWPMSDAWYYHDWLMGKWGDDPFTKSYSDGLEAKFGGPADNLEQFSWRAQLLNYESYRAIIESWNSRMWDNSSGILLWMSHPAWNSFTWQTYSRDCETPGTYFGAKKASTPLHIQMNLNNYDIDIINTTLKSHRKLKVTAKVFDMEGRELTSQSTTIDETGANRAKNAFRLTLQKDFPDLVLVRLYLRDQSGRIIDDNTYWLPKDTNNIDLTPFNQLAEVSLKHKELRYRRTDSGIEGSFTIVNNSAGVALAVKLTMFEKDSGKQVLPTLFSDGYFTLMPGESKNITFRADSKYYTPGAMTIFAEGYNVPREALAEATAK